jgi:hypothetical protein
MQPLKDEGGLNHPVASTLTEEKKVARIYHP